MSAASVVSGLDGVSACVVGDKTGRVVECTGADVNATATMGAVITLVSQLRAASSMLGLGEPQSVTSKGPDRAWVVGADANMLIAVCVAAGRSTTAVESVVSRTNWSISIEWDVNDSDLEYVSGGESPPKPNQASLRPTRPAPTDLSSEVSAPAPAPPEDRATRDRTAIPAGVGGDADSGLKWRAAPKYRVVKMQGPKSGRIDSPSPAGKQAPLMRPPVPDSWDDSNAEITRSSGRTLASAPAFAGGLQTVSVPDLLEFLRIGQRTGTMVCSSAAGTGRVLLRSGKLLGASSPTTRPLPGYLVASGTVTLDALRALPNISPEAWSGPAIGSLLIKSGIVTTVQVREALGAQIRDALSDLLTWRDGEFSFDSDVSVDTGSSDAQLEFDPQSILLRICKDQDDSSQAAK